MDRIERRGRDYERTITPEYLQSLNDLYEDWISNFVLCPVLAVPADDLDYVAYSGHLDLIISKVNEKLTGKDEVVFEAEAPWPLRCVDVSLLSLMRFFRYGQGSNLTAVRGTP